MAHTLDGKVAVVTGGSKGIGASIALHLAAEGAAVIVNYASSKAGADRVVSEITGNGGRAVAVQADVSREADVKRLFAEARNAFGRLDILVNNAGIYEFAPIESFTVEHYRKHFDTNVLSTLLATREAVKDLQAGGVIVNLSSVVATGALPSSAVYSATKASIDSITRTLAAELGPRKIRVNAVSPGMVETEGTVSMGIAESDMRKQVEQSTPLGRIGQPKDIASAVVFLASPGAEWITGQSLMISGGHRL